MRLHKVGLEALVMFLSKLSWHRHFVITGGGVQVIGHFACERDLFWANQLSSTTLVLDTKINLSHKQSVL